MIGIGRPYSDDCGRRSFISGPPCFLPSTSPPIALPIIQPICGLPKANPMTPPMTPPMRRR
jgi:hypothetical protein